MEQHRVLSRLVVFFPIITGNHVTRSRAALSKPCRFCRKAHYTYFNLQCGKMFSSNSFGIKKEFKTRKEMVQAHALCLNNPALLRS